MAVIKIQFIGKKSINWFLELTTASGAVLPFKKISAHTIDAEFEGMKYSVNAESGSFANDSAKATFRAQSENNKIELELNTLH